MTKNQKLAKLSETTRLAIEIAERTFAAARRTNELAMLVGASKDHDTTALDSANEAFALAEDSEHIAIVLETMMPKYAIDIRAFDAAKKACEKAREASISGRMSRIRVVIAAKKFSTK